MMEVLKHQRCQRTAVIFIGIQGSGKTHFFKQHFEGEYDHINLDTLRTRKNELAAIENCISNGRNFVVDNTNPTRLDRHRYIPVLKEAGYHIVGYFMESKIKPCIERNNLREGKAKVPPAAIAATSNKLEIPSYEEGFDELFFVGNDGLRMTVHEWR